MRCLVAPCPSSLSGLDPVPAEIALEVVGVEDHATAYAVEGHRTLPDQLAYGEHGDAQDWRRLLDREAPWIASPVLPLDRLVVLSKRHDELDATARSGYRSIAYFCISTKKG